MLKNRPIRPVQLARKRMFGKTWHPLQSLNRRHKMLSICNLTSFRFTPVISWQRVHFYTSFFPVQMFVSPKYRVFQHFLPSNFHAIEASNSSISRKLILLHYDIKFFRVLKNENSFEMFVRVKRNRYARKNKRKINLKI